VKSASRKLAYWAAEWRGKTEPYAFGRDETERDQNPAGSKLSIQKPLFYGTASRSPRIGKKSRCRIPPEAVRQPKESWVCSGECA
jgi:hypothetical protein